MSTAAAPSPPDVPAQTVSYRCSGCGYGITVRSLPDACPMCRGDSWIEDSRSRNGLFPTRPGAAGDPELRI
jgi:hypothetical protein